MSGSPEDILKSILSDPDAVSKIGNILGSLKGESAQNEGHKEEKTEGDSSLDMASILKIGKMFDKINEKDDDGVKLITALMPYLSDKRSEGAKKAVKLLRLSKLGPLLSDMDLF